MVRLIFSGALFLFALALAGSAPASATFGIFPTTIDVNAKRGGGASGTFNVRLEGERGERFAVRVQDLVQRPDGSFAVQDPTGSGFSASRWISVAPRVFAGGPDRVQPVSYAVLAPRTAEPGDHLASLTVTRLPPRGETTTTPLQAISVRVAVRVAGEITPAAEITSLDAPRIAGGNPVVLSAVIRNTGNVRLDFDRANKGSLAILAGSERRVAMPLDGTLYPGQQRPFELSWDDAPLFGQFRAVASVEIGDKVVEESNSILVLPWRQMAALVLIGLSAIVVAVARSRRRWGSA